MADKVLWKSSMTSGILKTTVHDSDYFAIHGTFLRTYRSGRCKSEPFVSSEDYPSSAYRWSLRS